MPIAAFKCDVTGKKVEFEACIGCAESGLANRLGCLHSPSVLQGIVRTIRKSLDSLSVTELLDCPRALYFKKQKDYAVSPSKAYWAFRGTMIHAILETSAYEGDISEKRFETEISGVKLSGQPDLVRGACLYDYKTSKLVPAKPQEHHIIQVSAYRWLLSRQNPAIEVNKAKIVYMDMSRHMMLPIELWDLKKTEDWIKERLVRLSFFLEQCDPPPFKDYFNPKDWKCGPTPARSYCDVRDFCTTGETLPEPKTETRKVHES